MKAKKAIAFLTTSFFVLLVVGAALIFWNSRWVVLSESEKMKYAFEIKQESAIRFSDEGEIISSVKILFGLPKKENPLCFWVVRMTKADKTPDGEKIYKRRNFVGVGPFYYTAEESEIQLEFKNENEGIAEVPKSISL